MKNLNKLGEFWTTQESNKTAGLIKNSELTHQYILQTLDKLNENDLILGNINGNIISLNKELYINDQYYINTIFENGHFLKKEDIKFNKVKIILTNVDDWFDKSNLLKKNKKPIYAKYTLKCFDMKIDKIISKKFINKSNEFKNIEKTIITLNYKQNTSYFDIIEKDIEYIKNFFLFNLGDCDIEKITASNEKIKNINIYTPLMDNINNKFNYYKMLFKKSDIDKYNKKPYDIFKRWFKLQNKLEPIFDLYFSIVNSNNYAETDFLLYLQAIEAYHRRRENEYKDDSFVPINPNNKDHYDLKGRLMLILNKIDCSVINYILDKKLITLKELPEKITDKEKEYYNKNTIRINTERKKKICRFATLIADNRNYYTHYNPNEKYKKLLIKKDIINANKYLKCILEICILKELKFKYNLYKDKENNFDNIIYKIKRYQFLPNNYKTLNDKILSKLNSIPKDNYDKNYVKWDNQNFENTIKINTKIKEYDKYINQPNKFEKLINKIIEVSKEENYKKYNIIKYTKNIKFTEIEDKVIFFIKENKIIYIINIGNIMELYQEHELIIKQNVIDSIQNRNKK